MLNDVLKKNIIFRTILYIAVEKENVEVVRLLLARKELDINTLSISINFLYTISNHLLFLYHFINIFLLIQFLNTSSFIQFINN